jgi:hypothetical protein
MSVALLAIASTMAIASFAACSSTDRTSPFPEGTTDGGSPLPNGTSDGGQFFPPGDAAIPPGTPGCAEEAKLVYVVSDANDLYSFKPDTLTFTKVGRLDCRSAALATPNSMAVDRSGAAWVNYSDGTLFKVSTKDATCQSTPFQAGQNNFVKFGMAFSSNSAGSNEETLFVAGLADLLAGGRAGLGKIDLGTMKLSFVGDYTGTLRGQGAELTGTGDAKLFGFYTTDPATLATIDKASGQTSDNRALTGVRTGEAWAFSFWGGDFWFYTAQAGQESKVTRMKTASDGSIAVVMPAVGGFRIVGAGVSTCAPTAPPR